MITFNYNARNKSGGKQTGTIQAESLAEAAKKLKGRDLIVIDLAEPSVLATKSHISFGNSVSDKDKIVFTQQLSIMLKAGLPISQALHSAGEETSSKALGTAVLAIAKDVEGGLPLSTAFGKHSNIFSQVYVSVIKAGEKSGQVETVLSRLASQLEKDYDLKSKVKSALSYPIFVLIAMVIIVSLIMIFIIPQIQTVFTENDAKLPILTVVVIGISNIIRHQFLFIIGGVVAVVAAYRFYYRTASGKIAIDTLKLRIPVFGTLLKRVSIARFARIFSTLLSAGIPMLEIFETAKDVSGNEVFRREFGLVGKDVENGLELSAALRKQPHVPHIMVQLTAVAEKSGDIDQVYDNLASFMEKEVDNMTRTLSTLLEPALMLIMGAVIGTIVIAILLPIYSLTSSIV